jgi:choline-sulfatase
VTTESIAWVLNFMSTRSKRPWFLCASYYRPHFPLTAPARYIQMYLAKNLELPPLPEGYPDTLHPHDRFIVDDFNLTRFSADECRRALAAYYAALDYVEDRIGEMLAGLQKEGALDNTYVVYTSDHGEMAGEHGLWWKRTYYEASAGVPLLVSGPGIAMETQITQPVELVDLFPTFCEWAGIETPSDLDGESLTPLLTGHPERRRKHTALSELLGESGPTRFRMARDARWKYVDFPDAPPRLFDLQSDPGETRDLIDAPPPEVPLDELRARSSQGGTWDEIAARRAAIYGEREPFELLSASSAHYRLPDGRIIEADDHLYDGRSVK